MSTRGERLTLDEILNTVGPEYRVVAPIVCVDGFKVSVQASIGHYCIDSTGTRPGISGDERPVPPYQEVEVGYPSKRPEPWRCSAWAEGFDRHEDHPVCDGWGTYADSEDGDFATVYGYVPVQMVRDLIASHGGAS